MIIKSFLTASLLIAGTLDALAQDPAYKAEDIVKFFADGLNQSTTRGLCVGTAEECGAVQPKQKPLSFDLMVNFKKNSAVLEESAKANLMEFSKALRDPRLSVATFAVEGHTDASGTEGYNLGLSERRAQAVVSFLNEQGVNTTKLVAEGFGEDKPLTPDPFDPINRRVETRLVIR